MAGSCFAFAANWYNRRKMPPNPIGTIKAIFRKLISLVTLPIHWRRILASLIFLAVIASFVFAAYRSYRELPVALDREQQDLTYWYRMPSVAEAPTGLSRDVPAEAYWKYYRVVLESIDEITGTARFRADLQMPRQSLYLVLEQYYKGERSGHYDADSWRKDFASTKVFFGDLSIVDLLGIQYESYEPGWRNRKHSPPGSYRMQLHPIRDMPVARSLGFIPANEAPPATVRGDVTLEGDSWLYPFDRYLVHAKIHCPVVATTDHAFIHGEQYYFPVPGDNFTLASQVPNVVVRTATNKVWARVMSRYLDVDAQDFQEYYAQSHRSDQWRDGIIMLALERPFFLRFFAVFFGVVAICWIGIIACSSDPKQLTLSVFGYFLALWAVRAPLAAGAPKLTTLMDYVTLGLYALLIAIAAAKFLWGFKRTAAPTSS